MYVNKILIILAGLLVLSSCTYRSNGAYLEGSGSTAAFAPLHQGVARILSPDLSEQYCYGQGEKHQKRIFSQERHLEINNDEIEKNDLNYKYKRNNYCK